MAKSKLRRLDGEEQSVLEQLQVRLLTSKSDIQQCDQLIPAPTIWPNTPRRSARVNCAPWAFA